MDRAAVDRAIVPRCLDLVLSVEGRGGRGIPAVVFERPNFGRNRLERGRNKGTEIPKKFHVELRSPRASAEVLAKLVKKYGGNGTLLWWKGTRGYGRCIFEVCLAALPKEKMVDFVRQVVADDPGLASRNGPSEAGRHGPTLLDMAIEKRAPLEVVEIVASDESTKSGEALHRACVRSLPAPTIELLVKLNPDALTIWTESRHLAIHIACRCRPLDPATLRVLVEADPVRATLKTQDGFGRLPLHSACEGMMEGSARQALELEAIQLLIDAHPAALAKVDHDGMTPIMRALSGTPNEDAEPGFPVFAEEAIQFLGRAIRRGGVKSVRRKCPVRERSASPSHVTALHRACKSCLHPGLVSTLINVYPEALDDTDHRQRLPLHLACLRLIEGRTTELEAIRLLIEARPAALEARDEWNMTPIMIALRQRRPDSNLRSPEVVRLLKDMIRLSPAAVRGIFPSLNGSTAAPHFTTVLELACKKIPDMALVTAVIDAWPAVFYLPPTGALTDAPSEIASVVAREAFGMCLAVVEVLLHETTEDAVDEEIRECVRRAVAQGLPRDEMHGSSLDVVRAIRYLITSDQDRQRLRSDLFFDGFVQQFLWSHRPLGEMVLRVNHMNKAGRLGATEAGISTARQAHILAAATNNLSCLFLHLRDCPVPLAGNEAAKALPQSDADSSGRSSPSLQDPS